VTIRIRTAKNNVDSVYLVSKGQRHPMYKVESTEDFDFKELTINSSNKEKEFLYKVMLHIKRELETYNLD